MKLTREDALTAELRDLWYQRPYSAGCISRMLLAEALADQTPSKTPEASATSATSSRNIAAEK
jgi:hypothetical protein